MLTVMTTLLVLPLACVVGVAGVVRRQVIRPDTQVADRKCSRAAVERTGANRSL